MNHQEYKIGIMGAGMVGGALSRYFKSQGIELVVYDPPKNIGSGVEINTADILFVAVPTPYDEEKGGFDLSFTKEAFNVIEGEKVVVLKSTILPGTTNKFQEKYPHLKILFNPEFLTEATVDQDMCFPQRQIIGYTEQSRGAAEMVLSILPDAPFKKIMPAADAEMVKYFSNTWYATKVVFANQLFDLCQKAGVNYEEVKECARADKMIGENHLEIFHKGYRGYGGKCLKKDTRALIQLGDELGMPMALLKKVEEINNALNQNG